ncbi:hypothetical protein [Desulfosarcina sp.]|uniref:hypothetical protein n=1 Tax=Desulfosarcina sp. TaxID=2027861 RepID=UPI003970EFD8
MTLSHLKPAVPKCWLFAVSGVVWSLVGLMMLVTGLGWLAPEGFMRGTGFMLAGLALAAMAFRWGFSGIARKNIRRLRRLPQRGCFFAFQAWQGYLIIMTMIAFGVVLRQSSIPKSVQAIVYTAIGGALLMGSLHYYFHLTRMMQGAARRFADRRTGA